MSDTVKFSQYNNFPKKYSPFEKIENQGVRTTFLKKITFKAI